MSKFKVPLSGITVCFLGLPLPLFTVTAFGVSPFDTKIITEEIM